MNSKVNLLKFDANIGLNRGVRKSTEIFWYLIKTIFFLSAIPYSYQF